MNQAEHIQRMTENEAVFRQWNESIHGLNNTQHVAAVKAQVFCECSDENCAQKITIDLRDYVEIHKRRNEFVICPGHQVAMVEKIVTQHPAYTVVRKNFKPSAHPVQLKPTSVNNT